MKKLVTKESLVELLNSSKEKQIQVVGRALVALFNRQVEDEKTTNDTKYRNGVGFSPSDAKSGTLTAKYFLKHKTLLEWQVEKWLARTPSGFPKIAKYSRQLNEVALEKKTNK